MKIRLNDDKILFKRAGKTLENTAEKILKLETPSEEGEDSEVIKFRREFEVTLEVLNSRSKREEWYLKLTSNREKFNRYQKKMIDLASLAGFKSLKDEFGIERGTEFNTLEEFLIGGEIMGQRNSAEAAEDDKRHHINREWETATLARRLRDKLNSGKTYEEIAEFYYNKIRPPDTPKVTAIKLRQVISRANRRLSKKITKR